MLAYVLRRLAATIPVMLIVAVLVFLMLRLTPSDPAAIIAGDNANSEQVAEIRKRLGLDQPILTQFVIWIGKTLQGDLGESFFFKKQVTELILDRLEPTLSLALFTIMLAVLIAVPLGVIAAYRHGGWLDRIVMGFSVLGFSVPVFVIGYLLDLRLRHPAQLAPRAGLSAHLARDRRMAAAAHPAVADAVRGADRADRPHHAHQRARGDERGLHPHRPRQGPDRAQGADPARARQRRGADRDGHRPRRCRR